MECPNIPEIRYGEFSRRLHDKVGSRRLPMEGSIELTHRCNLRCAHCYINEPLADEDTRQRELPAADWCRIIDEIAAQGCLWLLVTGGEPLLHPDFLDIYTYAKKKGIFLILFTNATLLTPAMADHLARWRPFLVEVSIYGHTQATHEAVTGIPGSYERCRRGIKLLRERKIPLTLKTMVITLNQHEIRDMQNWARELGVQFRFDAVLQPRLDGSRTPCTLRISPEKIVELDLADERRLKEWKSFWERFHEPPANPAELFHCGAGINMFHIDPYGNLSACMMARNPSYNLPAGSFAEGWQDFLSTVRAQKRQGQQPCAACSLISMCGQCPGWSQVEHGDQESLVEYLCRIAHLRAEAFGLLSKAE
jgi:radical SAM protein with 4Fe4S-binding SPASM domain